MPSAATNVRPLPNNHRHESPMIGFLVAMVVGAYSYLGYTDAKPGHTYPVRLDTATVNVQEGQHVAVWYGASTGQWPSRRSLQAGILDKGGGPYAYIERGTQIVFSQPVSYGQPVKVSLRCREATDVCTVSLLGHHVSLYLPGRRSFYAGGESLFGASYTGMVDGTHVDG